MKKIFEKIIEGILTCSGFVTSITILLIVLFLFTEAFGLFNSKVIEEGYVLALNKGNKVNTLSPAQIKDVFDEEITNWKELGGEDLPIRVFRLEDITEYYTEEELGPAYEYAGERITQLVEKYDLEIDGIKFTAENEIVLQHGGITIELGEGEYLAVQMMNLGNILKNLEGMSGTLYMKDFDSENATASFSKN